MEPVLSMISLIIYGYRENTRPWRSRASFLRTRRCWFILEEPIRKITHSNQQIQTDKFLATRRTITRPTVRSPSRQPSISQSRITITRRPRSCRCWIKSSSNMLKWQKIVATRRKRFFMRRVLSRIFRGLRSIWPGITYQFWWINHQIRACKVCS